jgi:hypothetical protein
LTYFDILCGILIFYLTYLTFDEAGAQVGYLGDLAMITKGKKRKRRRMYCSNQETLTWLAG